MILGHALEDVPEIGEGLHIIEFCRGDEGTDGRPTLSAAIGTGEQMVLAPKRDGSDRVLSLRRETSVRIGLRGALDTMSVTDPRATCCRMPGSPPTAQITNPYSHAPHQRQVERWTLVGAARTSHSCD